MRVSEILRQLADLVDRTEDAEGQDTTGMQPEQGAEQGPDVAYAHLEPVEVAAGEEADTDSMVSPLQQEHELLKKSQGVDNHVDEFAGDEDDTEMPESIGAPQRDTDAQEDWEEEDEEVEENKVDQGYDSELAAMKRSAGIGEEQVSRDVSADARPVSLNPRANAALQAHGKPHQRHTQRRNR